MLAMDLVLIMEFRIAGIPADAYLSLGGSLFKGGITLGIVLQIAAGAASGVVFAILATQTKLRNIRTVKGWVFGVFFWERPPLLRIVSP